jgi:hypothetical protein
MMRNGKFYQLEALELPIKGKGSGWLPTLCASDWKGFGRGVPKSSCKSLHRWQQKYWRDGNTNYPNPLYWEWAMGFPAKWTELDASVIASVRLSQLSWRKKLKRLKDGTNN